MKESGITNRDYMSGKETRFYILTIKMDNINYNVKVLDRGTVIATSDSEPTLDAAKKKGVCLLLQTNANTDMTDVTMVHYKDDRPNGRPWQKDSVNVLKQLFDLEKMVINKQINYAYLQESLEKFNRFRETQEEKYQAVYRQPMIQIVSVVGPVLRRLASESKATLEDLIEVLSGQNEGTIIRQHVQKLFHGSRWLDDFLVFLQQADPSDCTSLLQELFEQGITENVRRLFGEKYFELLRDSKLSSNKMKVEIPNHLLAMLLASYSPDDYVFYKPNDFGLYVDNLGLNAPNDVVERYALYNEVAHLILNYAREEGYNVHDLIDAYHVVYLLDKYTEETGGVSTGMEKNQPMNKILYGPPGTGKTYHVIYEALSKVDPAIDPDLIKNPSRRDEAVRIFNRYVDSNHIMFCTFHQSFSYEEFVEGIRYSQEKQGYEVQDGVFKRLCNTALATSAKRKQTYDFDPNNTQFFKMSLGNTATDDDEVYDYCIANNVIALGWGRGVDFTGCEDKQSIRELYGSELPQENPYGVEFVERFKHWMRIDDIVIISHGNKKVRAIGKIIGDYTFRTDSPIRYHQFRSVQWLYEDNEIMLPVQSVLREKVFSQQTVYMFYNKDLNIESLQELISGNRNQSGQEQPYVLIIDEINRGNISKIFGELITLIEPDKRRGQKNEISVTLPYSGDRLRVPSNVHILGTMNTADRSIALLDTALRRRFAFQEMMPDYELLPTDVDGVNIRKLLETINQRIEYLYDRDHVIGHSYFMMEKPELDGYLHAMCNKVIPLLQEYFYEDWEQIELVLGGAGKPRDRSYFLNKYEQHASNLFNKSTVSLETSKIRFVVQPHPTREALERVYQDVQVQDRAGQ